MTSGVALLHAAYAPLVALADGVDDDQGWTPTGLPGWTTRELLFHLLADARRGLVALGTPSSRPVDTDPVSYWAAWRPDADPAGAAGTELRMTRISASVWTSVRGPASAYAEAARALLHLAAAVDPTTVVTTQGRVLTVDTLLSTLAVEAAIHHLDLEPVLPEPPAVVVLAGVRAVLDSLLGRPVPTTWADVRWARLATGRAVANAEEAVWLGPLEARLPLFG